MNALVSLHPFWQLVINLNTFIKLTRHIQCLCAFAHEQREVHSDKLVSMQLLPVCVIIGREGLGKIFACKCQRLVPATLGTFPANILIKKHAFNHSTRVIVTRNVHGPTMAGIAELQTLWRIACKQIMPAHAADCNQAPCCIGVCTAKTLHIP